MPYVCRCPCRSEEGISFPSARVKVTCEPLTWILGSKLGSCALEDQQMMLFTTKQSLLSTTNFAFLVRQSWPILIAFNFFIIFATMDFTILYIN